MGCRLTRTKAKTHDQSRYRHREELHFVDEYGQPITVHVDGRRGRGRRRRRSHCAVECSAPPERQWDALRVMGLMDGEDGQGPFYGHMPVSPDLYSPSTHMMIPPDVYPSNGYLSRGSGDQQHPANSYLPSVSYSLDHLDRLDYQGPEMSSYQPNSESCLIGCYNTEEVEPKRFHRQPDYRPSWRSDRPLGYLPLSELDSGLGCCPDSPHHRVALSEAETDAMSSLPGHTPLLTGTGEHRRLHKIHTGHTHRQTHHLRSVHSPREQRGRWDLESIPETTPVTHTGPAQSSRCTVGNSTTTTVHFHRAERSPTLPRHRSPPSPSIGCRTEPCQRRALWLEQQQGGGGTIDAPGRSRTITDLSESQRRRRASHPNTTDPNLLKTRLQNSQTATASSTLGPRSRASYPSNTPPTAHLSLDSRDRSVRLATRGAPLGAGMMTPPCPRALGRPPAWRQIGVDFRLWEITPTTLKTPWSHSTAHWEPPAEPSLSALPPLQTVQSEVCPEPAAPSAGLPIGPGAQRSHDGRGGSRRRRWRRRRGQGGDGRLAGRLLEPNGATNDIWHCHANTGSAEGRSQREGGGQGSQTQTVLELSHMKQNRLRNSKLFGRLDHGGGAADPWDPGGGGHSAVSQSTIIGSTTV
ncbi:uncharacterized protein LOC115421966 [Sphaeramia orbicularis]|uniref:uncharacterized protein LOC115421966 n=1 Tax=Sphaeramia orbicularis TaxID=375764 RepID=UPI00117EAF3D|nr:uncharacterized protein LOC115421966 [Sphaeramia orbicularis]